MKRPRLRESRYATHIFDQLSTWATHFLFFSGGKVRKFCRFEEFQEYHALVEAQTRVPLYMLIKQWVHEEYPETAPMEWTNPRTLRLTATSSR
jgi:ABC-type uncharacterized transport system ATPase subunit